MEDEDIDNRKSDADPRDLLAKKFGKKSLIETTVSKAAQIRQAGKKYFDTTEKKERKSGIGAALVQSSLPKRDKPTGLGLGLGLGKSATLPTKHLGLGLATQMKPSAVPVVLKEEEDMVDDEDAPAEKPGKGGRDSKKPPELLLVEDVRVSQRVAMMALKRAGFKHIAVADAGNQAVDQFKAHPTIKIVLMDIQLGPESISGTEATRQIRQFEKDNGREPVPIFGLTGNVSQDDLASYREAGLNGCIAKGNLIATAVKEALTKLKENPTDFVTLTET